ncbi:MAG: phage holin family protein [Negativicutes bacterium]|nr:phage holin family protein [Negativicutes bacterium]
MNGFLVTLISNAVAIFIMPYLFSGFQVANLGAALAAALVLGLVNAFIKPVMLLLSLPLTILTFGLFAFVINGATLMITAHFVEGFRVNGWGTAIIGAIILSLISNIVQKIIT